MPDAWPIRPALLSLLFVVLRAASTLVVGQPGYTDAYYYFDVATRLARGAGLTADFVWAPLELGALPVASHRFWMPIASVLQAASIAPLGTLIGDLRAAQLVLVFVAAVLPFATYICARSLGAGERLSLVAAAIVGLGGLFAPAWVSFDGFGVAALLGMAFFVVFARAASGSALAGALAGILVGLLYLTRAETALFGLALLALALRPATRAAGLFGAALALAIGGGWLVRDVAIGTPSQYLARTAFLGRYQDFFALGDVETLGVVPLSDALGARASALVANAGTFVFAYAIVLVVPLVAGVRALWTRGQVRAWTLLAALVFGAESLIWTLHSTRGSYFHSLAAFYGFGVAIAAVGAERLLMSRGPNLAAAWSWGALLLVAAMSAGTLQQWDAAFNTAERERAASLDAIPSGAFLAIDAAAWRFISGRTVLFTPADGIAAAGCVANVPEPHATSIVLEDAHFSAYDELYRGGPRPDWLGAPIERGRIKIFPIVSSAPCAIGFGP
ncbi:MAG TPA: hypothetical protein VEU77_09740 [Candidatus Acidoferrales bacterium]|nr:hypothetical protein [Candidatus Acidoferrales bacterium]